MVKCPECGTVAVYVDCDECSGTGEVTFDESDDPREDYTDACEACDGSGVVPFCETCDMYIYE